MKYYADINNNLWDDNGNTGFMEDKDPLYITYVEHLKAGGYGAEFITTNTTEIPLSISMRQARLALLNAGLLDSIENAMASMPKAVQIEWEYASVIERNNPLISQIASSFGLSEEQLNDLFILGSKI